MHTLYQIAQQWDFECENRVFEVVQSGFSSGKGSSSRRSGEKDDKIELNTEQRNLPRIEDLAVNVSDSQILMSLENNTVVKV